jgi:hypothetical protein
LTVGRMAARPQASPTSVRISSEDGDRPVDVLLHGLPPPRPWQPISVAAAVAEVSDSDGGGILNG